MHVSRTLVASSKSWQHFFIMYEVILEHQVYNFQLYPPLYHHHMQKDFPKFIQNAFVINFLEKVLGMWTSVSNSYPLQFFGRVFLFQVVTFNHSLTATNKVNLDQEKLNSMSD